MGPIRQDQILQLLTLRQRVTIEDLKEELHVSVETIRRDLKTLEGEGHLRRVYGGAILASPRGVETEYTKRANLHVTEKQAIAQRACDLINDGDTIVIDVGTTTLEFVKLLNSKRNLTILTNAMQVALRVLNETQHKVYFLGGLLRQGEDSSSGTMCINCLENYYVDKAIIGAAGISASFDITDYHEPENAVRKKMMEIAGQVIVLADHSKFGITAFCKLCNMSKVDILVTDWSTPKKTIAQLNSECANLEILVAEQSGGGKLHGISSR